MAAPDIPSGKDFWHVGGIAADKFGARFGIAAVVFVHAKRRQHGADGRDKTHRQQHQIGGQRLPGAGHFLHLAVFPLDANRFQTGDFAAFNVRCAANKFLGGNGELALATFLVARTGAQLDRPVGPGHGAVFFFGRLRHQLELGHAGRAVPIAGADAIRAGVAAANDDDMLAGGRQLVFNFVAGIDLVLLR